MKFGKKLFCILGLVIGILALAGCENTVEQKDEINEQDTLQQKDEINEQDALQQKDEINEQDALQQKAETNEQLQQKNTESADGANKMELAVTEPQFAFADISNHEFYFSSGAGGWCTVMYVHEDGTFNGNYHDSDMGDTGEGYPNGVMYYCDFEGKFTQPEKVNDYTYSMRIENIRLENEPGTEEIIDGVCYRYSEPYGLEGDGELHIYLPGSQLSDLPEMYLSWIQWELDNIHDGELPFYGLYNLASENGFSSYMMSEVNTESTEMAESADIDAELAAIEAEAAVLNEQLQSGLLNQMELNQTSAELYQLWDAELNSIWKRLKEKLDENTMAALTEEQKIWIDNKESEILLVGSEYGEGSMRPLVENDRAAEMTRERVYELAEMLR